MNPAVSVRRLPKAATQAVAGLWLQDAANALGRSRIPELPSCKLTSKDCGDHLVTRLSGSARPAFRAVGSQWGMENPARSGVVEALELSVSSRSNTFSGPEKPHNHESGSNGVSPGSGV